MDERRMIGSELDEIQQQMKELEIRYEQYFAGIEKREPYLERKNLARQLRQYFTRRIVWTDLKFRYQGLASRFMSYSQYWDRILRLIDEGKYHRHLTKQKTSAKPQKDQLVPANPDVEVERIHRELEAARDYCGIGGQSPSKEKIAVFLDTQKEKIRERYGDRPVAFSIDTSNGKPRIKVSLKK